MAEVSHIVGGSTGAGSATPTRSVGRALSGTILFHGLLLLVFMWGGFRAAKAVEDAPQPINVVYLPDPGPGGGGGGNPAPPAPTRTAIPRALPPQPVPLVEPAVIPEPQPDPILHASIASNLNDLLPSSANGLSLGVSGGGHGAGVGPGDGPGVGPGSGGNSGGGPAKFGNGCSQPSPVRQPQPLYTSEAMAAKIQGDVTMEIVVRKDGTVGDVRLIRSLDATHGLDAAAIKTAKAWTFRPAVCQGVPVDMVASLVLEFRLH